MQNTGDINADGIQYEQDKQAWIQANPGQFVTQTPAPGPAFPTMGYSAVQGFQPTGDPQVDNPAYEQAKLQAFLVKETNLKDIEAVFVANKEVWETTDPARYQAYLNAIQAGSTPSVIPYSEYSTFSPTKQAVIDNHPSQYIIDYNQ